MDPRISKMHAEAVWTEITLPIRARHRFGESRECIWNCRFAPGIPKTCSTSQCVSQPVARRVILRFREEAYSTGMIQPLQCSTSTVTAKSNKYSNGWSTSSVKLGVYCLENLILMDTSILS